MSFLSTNPSSLLEERRTKIWSDNIYKKCPKKKKNLMKKRKKKKKKKKKNRQLSKHSNVKTKHFFFPYFYTVMWL